MAEPVTAEPTEPDPQVEEDPAPAVDGTLHAAAMAALQHLTGAEDGEAWVNENMAVRPDGSWVVITGSDSTGGGAAPAAPDKKAEAAPLARKASAAPRPKPKKAVAEMSHAEKVAHHRAMADGDKVSFT